MAARVISTASYRRGQSFITDGNTVRVVRRETDPFYEHDLTRRAALHNRETKERMNAAARRRQRSVSIAFPSMILLAAAVVMAVVLGYMMVTLHASVDSHVAAVRSMETELEALKTENDALEQSIDTSVDLAYVYNAAVGRLGMVHAGQNNVISYEKTESEYVRQYERIPEL